VKATLDYPPVWLLGALAVALAEGALRGPVLDVPALRGMGSGLALLAVALMALAAWEFARARSTIVPHQMPQRLITGGIFAWSRNPIYLADVLLLVGLSLRWGAVSGLLLALPLAWVLRARFIRPEEARLRAAFGTAAEAYFAGTRRWI